MYQEGERERMNETIKQAEALGYKLLIDEDYTIVTALDRDICTAEVHRDFRGPWKVQTTSYGMVSPEDVDKVIDGLKRGKEMVALLNEAGI